MKVSAATSLAGWQFIRQLLTELQNHINRITITKHWATKQHYRQGTAHMVDWVMADQAMFALPQGHQQWVTKLVV